METSLSKVWLSPVALLNPCNSALGHVHLAWQITQSHVAGKMDVFWWCITCPLAELLLLSSVAMQVGAGARGEHSTKINE